MNTIQLLFLWHLTWVRVASCELLDAYVLNVCVYLQAWTTVDPFSISHHPYLQLRTNVQYFNLAHLFFYIQ